MLPLSGCQRGRHSLGEEVEHEEKARGQANLRSQEAGGKRGVTANGHGVSSGVMETF